MTAHRPAPKELLRGAVQEGRCPQGLLDAASGSGSSDVPPEPPFFPRFLIACFAMLFAQLKDVAPSR